MDKGQLLQIIGAGFGILGIVLGSWGSSITDKGFFQTLTQISKGLVGLDKKLEEKIQNVHPVKSKIAMAKVQSVPPNEETRLNFDRLIYDTQEGFWQEGHPGFCDRSGIYDLVLALHFENIKSDISIFVIVNTSNERLSRTHMLSRSTPTLLIKKSFDIDRGDTVFVSVKHQGAQDLLISKEDDQTYLEIEEIGRGS